MPQTAATSNEREQALTLFFGRFLNTPEGMDAHLGFSGTHWCCVGFGRREPQIVIHVEAPSHVHYEKASEKDPQDPLLSSSE